MRIFQILMIVLLFACSNSAKAAHQLYADIDGINIPYGTKLELTMAQDITTANIAQGDIFQAYLANDIYINNKLILPSKTIFRGRVSEVKYSRAFSRPAAVSLTLDHLVTKQGTQLALNSGIASNFNYILKPDGSLTTNGNYFKAVAKDAKAAGQIVPRTINWGKTSGDQLFKGAKYVFVPIAAAGGAIACGCSAVYNTAADLFRHGDEIAIKKGSEFSIILLSTLEIPN